MSDVAQRLMDADEFLVWSEDQEERYELIDGVPVLKFDNGPEMMAGASEAHDQIVINIIQELRILRGGPCRVKSADQATRTAVRRVRRPDVTVDCGPRRPDSHESSEPAVLFEVLSPSTRLFDLLKKTDEYQHLPTLRHFVMLEPGEARAFVWTRAEDRTWSSDEVVGLEGVVDLPGIGAALPMTAVYEDVDVTAV